MKNKSHNNMPLHWIMWQVWEQIK